MVSGKVKFCWLIVWMGLTYTDLIYMSLGHIDEVRRFF